MAQPGRNNRDNRGNRQSKRYDGSTELLNAFGLDDPRQLDEARAPRSMEQLQYQVTHEADQASNNYGQIVNTIEVEGKNVRLHVDLHEAPFRDREQTPGENLPTREDLAATTAVVESEGSKTKRHGQFAYQIHTLLFLGREAVVVNQPELTRQERRGGLGGTVQRDASHEALSEIGEEMLQLATLKSGKHVLIAPALHGIEHDTMVRSVMNTRDALRDQLQRKSMEMLTAGGHVDNALLHNINHKLELLNSAQEIELVPTYEVEDAEVVNSLQTIETVGGHHTDKMKGYVYLDEATNTLRVYRPVRMDLSKLGINEDEIIRFDGTGADRTFETVDEPSRDLPPQLNAILSRYYRPEVVQRADKSLVDRAFVEQTKAVNLLQRPYSVPPSAKEWLKKAA